MGFIVIIFLTIISFVFWTISYSFFHKRKRVFGILFLIIGLLFFIQPAIMLVTIFIITLKLYVH